MVKRTTNHNSPVADAPAARAAARVARNVETALATRAPGTAEFPCAIAPLSGANGQSAVNLSLGISNFRTVAVAIGRQQMNAARTRAEAARDAARNRADNLRGRLTAAGRCLAEETMRNPSPQASHLLLAINTWLAPKRYAIVFVGDGYSRYGADKEKKREPALDVVKRQLIGELRFWQCNANTGRVTDDSHELDDFNRDTCASFTEEMNELADRLVSAEEAHAAAVADLKTVNRLAAQVDDRGDDVEAALTLAHLQGNLRSTQEIHDVIQQAMTQMPSLPERVRALLAAPADAASATKESNYDGTDPAEVG